MELTIKQTRAIDLLESKDVGLEVFGGGAGGGKSLLGCYWITKQARKYDGTRWLIGRNVLKTLRETTFQTHLEVLKMQGMIADVHYRIALQDFQIHLVNGSVIIYKDLSWQPSDPHYDRLGSLEISGAFIDEGSEIREKAMNVVRSRIRFKLEDYDISPTILITCNPARGWLYDIYLKDRNGTLPEDTVFIQSLLIDNPYIHSSYADTLSKLDMPSVQRLLHGNWEYQEDRGLLMPYDNCVDLFTNDFVKDDEKQKYLVCDIALQGADKFVLMVWHGFVVHSMIVVDKSSYAEIEQKIKEVAKANDIPRSRIIYDSDGVGDFLSSYLRGAVGFVNGAPPFRLTKRDPQNFENLKSQCYWKLAELVNEGKIYFQFKTEHRGRIIEELSVCRNRNWGLDGKLSILKKTEFKQELGYSPDFSDTLMMRMLPLVRGSKKISSRGLKQVGKRANW